MRGTWAVGCWAINIHCFIWMKEPDNTLRTPAQEINCLANEERPGWKPNLAPVAGAGADFLPLLLLGSVQKMQRHLKGQVFFPLLGFTLD